MPFSLLSLQDQFDLVGWLVFVTLLIFFAAVLAVTGARLWLSWRQKRMVAQFRSTFARIESLSALTALGRDPTLTRHPFGRIALAALQNHNPTLPSAHRLEQGYRALQAQLEREVADREWGLTLLATIASTAPYIGLLGTVWSTHRALAAIAKTGEATLATVAGPVGEALIMTAIGLAVAIPALIVHNGFVRANRLLFPELEAFAHECYLLLLAETQESPA